MTRPAASPPGSASAGDMVFVPGGTFRMGSDHHYPEEAPAHDVAVGGFHMDRCPVTNGEFAAFVAASGYVTLAERPPDPKDYPGLLPHMAIAGSLVFRQPPGPVHLRRWDQWWAFVPGADWRRPLGPDQPGHQPADGADHPVVHVAYADAAAYADWAGKQLPTEAEFECAARGGLADAEYAWGDELMPGGRHMANLWQGEFPAENLATDGYAATSPVGAFPANGYGLHDMIGNVWEWTADWYSARHPAPAGKSCCLPQDPRGGTESASLDPRQPEIKIPRKVLKGGSFLCAPNYCRRYRPAARQAQQIDSAASNVGFRCVVRGGA